MIFLIPARAGSKRLPGKNKRLFCGSPLWQWSLETALEVYLRGDAVVVSTDDPDILKDPLAEKRPPELCTDDATTKSVVDLYLQNDDVCLLQPTSPTRSISLVRNLIAHGGQVRSVTDGKPNGQCYVYRRGHEGWIDIETEKGHDIDTLEQFEEAERDMLRRFQ